MAFNICFINYVHTILVAKFVEAFLLRVVASAYGVHIILFPEFEILNHKIFRNVMPRVFIMLVYIHTFYKDRHAIYKQLLILNLYRTETYLATGSFYYFAIGALQADDECIKIRCFSRPMLYTMEGFLREFYFGLITFHTGRGLGYLLILVIE